MKKEVIIPGNYLLGMAQLALNDSEAYVNPILANVDPDAPRKKLLSNIHLRFKEDSVFIEASCWKAGGVLNFYTPDQIGNENQFQPNDTCIIPLQLVNRLDPDDLYTVTLDNGFIFIKSKETGIQKSLPEPEVKGTYPDLVKFIQKNSINKIEPAHYPLGLLERFRDAGNIFFIRPHFLGSAMPYLTQRGESPATVVFRPFPEFVGYIKPYIVKDIDPHNMTLPEWLGSEIINLEKVKPIHYIRCAYDPTIYITHDIDALKAYFLQLDSKYYIDQAELLINNNYEEVGPDYEIVIGENTKVKVSEYFSSKVMDNFTPGQILVINPTE
jgi:hypothetical protein